MPKPVSKEASPLDSYISCGLDVNQDARGKEAFAVCPFCDSERFSINKENGLARCWNCSEGGKKGGLNPSTFAEALWKVSFDRTAVADYKKLAEERSINMETLVHWGCAINILTSQWILPAYSAKSFSVRQLYHLKFFRGKKRFLATTGLPHQLFGLGLFNRKKNVVDVTEGPWDGMALWEMFGRLRWNDKGDGLEPAVGKDNLLKISNVIAMPGCTSFRESWCPIFAGKTVRVWLDNDHPKINPVSAKIIPPATYTALERMVGILTESREPPKVIQFCKWGEGEYYHNEELPNCFDIRDLRKTHA